MQRNREVFSAPILTVAPISRASLRVRLLIMALVLTLIALIGATPAHADSVANAGAESSLLALFAGAPPWLIGAVALAALGGIAALVARYNHNHSSVKE